MRWPFNERPLCCTGDVVQLPALPAILGASYRATDRGGCGDEKTSFGSVSLVRTRISPNLALHAICPYGSGTQLRSTRASSLSNEQTGDITVIVSPEGWFVLHLVQVGSHRVAGFPYFGRFQGIATGKQDENTRFE
jgi:hypothetical protein